MMLFEGDFTPHISPHPIDIDGALWFYEKCPECVRWRDLVKRVSTINPPTPAPKRERHR